MTVSSPADRPEGVREPSSLRLGLVALACLAIALLNLSQWQAVEASRDDRYRVLSIVREPGLVALAVEQDATVARWYGLARAIAVTAPGARVVLPADAGLTLERTRSSLVAFGEVSDVSVADLDSVDSVDELFDGAVPEQRAGGEAVGGVDAWMLYASPGRIETLVAFVVEGDPRSLAVIDARLLDADSRWSP